MLPNKRWHEIVARLPVGECVMVEIGVWRAKNALAILSIHPQVKMHLIDRWQASEYGDAYHLTGSKDARLNQHEFDRVKLEALAKLHPYRKRAIVHPIASDIAAAENFHDLVDLVFIDGDHSYDACLLDIRSWRGKVKPGGWLGGHDYGSPRFPGVEMAVNETFPNGVKTGADHTWWVRCEL